MVRTPNFKIEANGKDVTANIKANLESLELKDEANENADELTITVTGEIARPKYEDELKLYLGYGDNLTFCGLFTVQTTTRENNHILNISATGVNFSNTLKEKRDITYEQISISDICSQIAARNNLKVKSDFTDVYILSQAQSNESDLHFLNRLAGEYNAIFNIKNNTLIFTKKIVNDKKNQELPTYTIHESEIKDLSIKHSNKTLYKSCKSTWHDTKENKGQEILVGAGEPCLVNKGNFKNAAEAKAKANAKLQKANQGIIEGSFTKEGEVVFAGGTFDLEGTLEDDGEYQIKTVNHTFDTNGWEIKIDFER
ncbi:phage late control D family protein [Poseidonibacter lekithochrous]|uniref:phage late control D family protein n=1 Tax=Poseidonibacter lekithochrous TaxID=1904463 RepID=UPI000D375A7E|nr:contractile injection system protein, VgrG/Pvc8 family [Poseidonibacter lekithochrous]